MGVGRLSNAARYTAAIAAVAIATALRLLTEPLIGDKFPFIFMFVAVAFCAWYGGRGPSLVAIVLGGLSVTYFVFRPPQGFVVDAEQQVGLVLFAIVSMIISAFTDAMHHARRRAEQIARELRASQQLLQSFLDNSPASAYMKDDNGRYVLINRFAEQLYGRRAADWIGKTDFDIFPEEVAAQFRRNDLAVLKDEQPHEVEEVTTDPGLGTQRFWVSLKFPFRDATQRRFLAGLSLDVTQTRRAMQAVREHQELLRVTLASIGDAVIATDIQGRVTFLNRVAESLTGWSEQEASGQPLTSVFQIVHEFTGESCENPVERVLREGRVVGLANHTTLVARDGSRRIIEDSAAPIVRDGAMIGVVLVFRDVTERRQVEALEQVSMERLGLALEAGRMGVWEWNLLTNEVWWSDNLEAIHGLPEGSFGGTFEDFERLVHPDDRERVRSTIARALEERGRYDIEFRNVRPDGSFGWMVGKGRVFTEADGDDVHPVRMVGVAMDVTERRNAAEALRESEVRFAGMMSHAPAVIFIKDASGRYRMVNRVFEYNTGLTADQIIGKTDAELFSKEAAQRFRAMDADVLRTGEARQFEESFEHEGVGYTFLTIKFPLHDASGRPAAVGAIATDITDRKRWEEALRRSEEEYRILADGMPMFVFIADSDARIEYCNARWTEFSGLTLEQTIAGQGRALVHPDDQVQVRETFRNGLAGSTPFAIEYRMRAASDATYRWFVSRATPLHTPRGVVDKWVVAVLDIDDLRRAEEVVRSLLRVSERLNSTLDVDELLNILVREAIALVGAESGVAGLNTDKGMVSHKYFQRGIVLPLEYCWPAMHGLPGWLLIHKQPYLTNDAAHDPQIVHELCEQFGVQSALSTPIINARGEVLGFFEVHNKTLRSGFTLADQQQLLAVSQAAAIAIENAIAYRKLQHAEASLKEADRRKDDFLATLAHELRNPLAPIRNALQVMRLADGDKQTIEQSRSMMERQLQQMVRLIDDLLDVSRITRNKLELRKERVELAKIVSSAVETSKPLLDAMRHRLTVSLPSEHIYLDADFTRLAQVFGNLLNNAAKYTHPGGHVRLTARRSGGAVVVTVKDSGVGIAPEHLPHLFEMFAQVAPPLERSQGGLGIGLALARGLVEMHGGHIDATSGGIGKGSEFSVTLPALREERPRAEEAIGPHDPHVLNGFRILVVDDNRDSADSLAMMLGMVGHTVQTAYDGLEAVHAVAEFRPKVVLLDIGMPKLNGYEAARRVRDQPGGAEPVLIALTGWGQEEDKRLAKEAGFDFHLTKPVDPSVLVKLLSGLTA